VDSDSGPEDAVLSGFARDVTERQQAATEQDALRRIATLAAEGVQPADLFALVAKEVGRVIDVPLVRVMRYEADDSVTQCASFSAEDASVPFGSHSSLEGTNVLRLVRDTSKAARIDDYSGLEGEIAEGARSSWIRSAVGSPIVVAGHAWGAVVASSPVRLPNGTERRLADFTDLLATVIENTESREALTRLAEEQAALRRVATLVARGAPSQEIFTAVTEELGQLVPVGQAAMSRYDSDNLFTTVAIWCTGPSAFAVGEREVPGGRNVMSMVLETGRPARIDNYSDASGPIGVAAREAGYRSAVGTPIVVEGRLWGIMTAASSRPEPLPPDTEARLASFTELVATAIANAESRSGLARLAEEQAAQRRVAVLVAEQASPDQVFTAVTEAVGGLLDADLTAMHTFRDDEMAVTVAGWSDAGPMLPIGTRLPLKGDSVVARIYRSGAPARMDTYIDVEGESADVARGLHLRSTVGAPILVDGKLWGALVAATRSEERFPEDAETRIAAFTELVATAISNTQAREAVARLANEQAALRRVATLVARGVRPTELFSAVSIEVGRLVGSAAAVLKFEDDGQAVDVVGVSSGFDLSIGTRLELQDGMAPAEVYRTLRSYRVDAMDWPSAPDPDAAAARRLGGFSTVASPIIVEGRLWGAMTVSSSDELLPLDAEERLEKFTELIATAIANADSKAELAASRRRIVAASDEARRRIERDLHDGTQQRLVTLAIAAAVAEADLPPDSPVRSELSRIATALGDAVTELQELSRGIHPAILTQGGLGAALRALARRSAIPVALEVDTGTRLPAALEVATYYVTSEALANATKHAQASRIDISLAPRDGTLQLSIRDDGIGGADPVHGSGLLGLADRVEALGGTIHVRSRPGEGTHISVELPLEPEVSETRSG
jgi:signal transduction histidine kinase